MLETIFNSGIQQPANQMTFKPTKQFSSEPDLNTSLQMPREEEADCEERGVMKKDKKHKKKKSRSSSSSSRSSSSSSSSSSAEKKKKKKKEKKEKKVKKEADSDDE